MPVIHNSAPTLHRFWDPHQKIWTNWHFLFFFSFSFSDNFFCPPALAPPPPPIPAISKVNTPLNAGLTHFHCGWLCFQFSHYPTTLEEKRKLLSRKKVSNQCKRKIHFPKLLSAKRDKNLHGGAERETWSEMLLPLLLWLWNSYRRFPSFLSL